MLYLDYIGTFVFALTGSSIAIKSNFDFFGIVFLAFITATGGGTVRDLILDRIVFWTVNSIYFYLILSAAIVMFFLSKPISKIKNCLFLLDTVGLGTFAVIGVQISLAAKVNYESCIILGLISGVLGGILRSLFNKEVPIIFTKEVYATCAILSSVSYLLLTLQGVNQLLSSFISIFICLLFRLLAVKYKFSIPKAL